MNVDELQRLREVYAGYREDATDRLSVVGYFRTQSEGTLRLRDDELELTRKYFRDPN